MDGWVDGWVGGRTVDGQIGQQERTEGDVAGGDHTARLRSGGVEVARPRRPSWNRYFCPLFCIQLNSPASPGGPHARSAFSSRDEKVPLGA